MPDKTFLPFRLAHGHLAETTDDAFPSRLSAWRNGVLELPDDGTHFGYVHEREATLEAASGTFALRPGMYFAAPSSCRIGGSGQGVIITRLGNHGMFTLGGPVEPGGRLRYIDGCTDSLLIPPQMLGDPCLNALYFPAHISQTEHTHPSVRIGLVVRGTGECRTPLATFSLFPGLAFIIRADARHSFRTTAEEMLVVAYHPESDYGPTHEAHPMINRTMVRGVPASQIELIRTREDGQGK
ncbi:MAG TPA: AraC family ligand binding domain-containing protein [Pyrinomonadaceae bacterium]